MITRKLGKILRGKATPFQLYSACLIACLVGYLPSFEICSGLYLCLLFIIMILNANLLITALLIPLIKVLSMLTTPLSLSLGESILNGSIGETLIKPLINFPIIAWFGLEYYITIGNLILGLLLGIITGSILVGIVSKFRKTVADLEENSEKFKNITEKKWVKFLTWVFLGGKSKKPYQELLEKKVGNPIRILGIVAVFAALLSFYTAIKIVESDLIRTSVQNYLSELNGATVYFRELETNIFAGKIKIQNAEFANPKNLEENSVEMQEITAYLDIPSLLRKKIVINELSSSPFKLNTKRKEKAELFVKKNPEPNQLSTKEIKENTAIEKTDGVLPLEDYLKNFNEYKTKFDETKSKLEEWQQNSLVQAFLKKIKERKKEKEESLKTSIKDLYAQNTGKHIKALHLLDKSPDFLIKKIAINNINYQEGIIAIESSEILNLSDKPELIEPLTIQSVGKNTKIGLVFHEWQNPDLKNKFQVSFENISINDFAKDIIIEGEQPIESGVVNFVSGIVRNEGFDLTFDGNLHFKTLVLNSKWTGQQEMNGLDLLVAISPFRSKPTIKVDAKEFKKQILKQGKDKVVNEVKKEAKEAINEIINSQDSKEAQEKTKEKVNEAKDKLKNIFK